MWASWAGAEVLGEGIVFSVAALVLLIENRWAAANEVLSDYPICYVS